MRYNKCYLTMYYFHVSIQHYFFIDDNNNNNNKNNINNSEMLNIFIK